jgi:hypothetical protein
VVSSPDGRRVIINRTLMLRIVVLFRRVLEGKPSFYILERLRKRRPDFTLIIRVHPDGVSVLDYHLFPSSELPCQRHMRLTQDRISPLEAHRSETLDCIARLASWSSLVPQDELDDI